MSAGWAARSERGDATVASKACSRRDASILKQWWNDRVELVLIRYDSFFAPLPSRNPDANALLAVQKFRRAEKKKSDLTRSTLERYS